jgi:SWI/SNF-related matrix-associated actin-dependent regulator 1 of chromatin subfamily A
MKITEYDDNFIYFVGTAAESRKLGGVWVGSKRLWKIPISKVVVDSLNDPSLVNLKQELDNYHNLVYTIKNKNDTDGDPRLRPYQRVDVEFLTMRKNAAVFNEQRTGKTPTTLLAVKNRMNKGVVVCPAGLKLNWSREAQAWINRSSTVISGTKKRRTRLYKEFKEAEQGILILSYETLRADLSQFDFEFDVLIVDEAHRLRNYRTKQSGAVYDLAKMAKHVFALTGTPAVNHPADIFGILKLLRPKKYTSYWNFVDRYFGYEQTRFGRDVLTLKPHMVDEFTDVLDTVSVQRKRNNVMKWIPPITDRQIPLELSDTQQRYYKQLVETYRYDENVVPNAVALLTRLRQICLDTGLITEHQSSPKEDFIKEYISDNTDSVIVFSSFTSFLKKLHSKIPGSVLLTGEQTQAEKQAAVDKMQKGEATVMLANVVAGGLGWTLDKVDTIIFTDKSFNPINNEQAQDRIVPTVQALQYGAKQIITLIMSDTLEANIEKLLAAKQDIIQYVNNYGLNRLVDLDGEDYNISALGDSCS